MTEVTSLGSTQTTDDQPLATKRSREQSPTNGDQPVRDKLKKTSISASNIHYPDVIEPIPKRADKLSHSSSTHPAPQSSGPVTRSKSKSPPVLELSSEQNSITRQSPKDERRKRRLDDEELTEKSPAGDIEEVQGEGSAQAKPNDPDQATGRRHTRKRSRECSASDAELPPVGRLTRARRAGRSPSPIAEEGDSGKPSDAKGTGPSTPTTPDTSIESSTHSVKPLPVDDLVKSSLAPTKSELSSEKKADTGTEEVKDAKVTTPPAKASHILEPGVAKDGFSSPKKEPGTSAFASSGLSAFAGSQASPFGKVAAGASPFTAAFPKADGAVPPTSIFASPKAPASQSAFGGLGGVSAGSSIFGSPFGKPKSGPGLTSFASQKPAPAAKAEKPFGAPISESESEGSGDDEEGQDEQSGNADARFTRKDTVETGEEGESTFFSCRAKMYEYESSTKEWKEKGAGSLKLNTTATILEDGEDIIRDQPYECRLILRTDGVHRLILNQALVHGLKFGDENGKRPTRKQFRLVVSPSVLLSIGAAGQAAELYDKIEFLLGAPEPSSP